MKLAIFALITVTAAGGALATPTSASWGPASGAQPEALIMGASLLVLASLLRHRSPQKKMK